jgi:hypothetical protein
MPGSQDLNLHLELTQSEAGLSTQSYPDSPEEAPATQVQDSPQASPIRAPPRQEEDDDVIALPPSSKSRPASPEVIAERSVRKRPVPRLLKRKPEVDMAELQQQAVLEHVRTQTDAKLPELHIACETARAEREASAKRAQRVSDTFGSRYASQPSDEDQQAELDWVAKRLKVAHAQAEQARQTHDELAQRVQELATLPAVAHKLYAQFDSDGQDVARLFKEMDNLTDARMDAADETLHRTRYLPALLQSEDIELPNDSFDKLLKATRVRAEAVRKALTAARAALHPLYDHLTSEQKQTLACGSATFREAREARAQMEDDDTESDHE